MDYPLFTLFEPEGEYVIMSCFHNISSTSEAGLILPSCMSLIPDNKKISEPIMSPLMAITSFTDLHDHLRPAFHSCEEKEACILLSLKHTNTK